VESSPVQSQKQPADPPAAEATWERRSDSLVSWIGYILLAVATVLSLITPNVPLEWRLVMVAIAGLAALWMYVMFTRSPRPWQAHPVRMAIYMVGLLAIASVLMWLHPLFLIFAITGFFHATLLRPWPLMIFGVFMSSLLIHLLATGFPWKAPELWILFPAVIIIQTIAIGFGGVIGERLAESSEARRQAIVRLEAALDENANLHRQLVKQAREAGVMDERQRMAREIHDTIAHGLTGVVTQLEAAQVAADRPEERTRHIDNAARLAREISSDAVVEVKGSTIKLN
jgi:signal transduction histidine kinase